MYLIALLHFDYDSRNFFVDGPSYLFFSDRVDFYNIVAHTGKVQICPHLCAERAGLVLKESNLQTTIISGIFYLVNTKVWY